MQYKKIIYQIRTWRPTYALNRSQVSVREQPNGEITILYKGRPLDFRTYHKHFIQAEVVLAKSIYHKLDQLAKSSKSAADHPLRNYATMLISIVCLGKHPPK